MILFSASYLWPQGNSSAFASLSNIYPKYFFSILTTLVVLLRSAIAGELTTQTEFALSLSRGIGVTAPTVQISGDVGLSTEKTLSGRIGRLRNSTESMGIELMGLAQGAGVSMVLRSEQSEATQVVARKKIDIGPFTGSIPVNGYLLLERSGLDFFIRLPNYIPSSLRGHGFEIQMEPSIHFDRLNLSADFSDGRVNSFAGTLPSLGMKWRGYKQGTGDSNVWLQAQALRFNELNYLRYGIGAEHAVLREKYVDMKMIIYFESIYERFTATHTQGLIREYRGFVTLNGRYKFQ